MEEFEFTKGDYIKTNIAWNRPDIETFGTFLEKEFLPTLPKTHEAYLHGAFPHRLTWDIDIAIIGKPTDEVALWLIKMYNCSLNKYKLLLDMAIFQDNTLFIGIDEYNRTGNGSVLGKSNMYKPYHESYKNGEAMHYKDRKVEKISNVLYKHYIIVEGLRDKFKNKVINHPLNLKTFQKVYNV